MGLIIIPTSLVFTVAYQHLQNQITLVHVRQEEVHNNLDIYNPLHGPLTSHVNREQGPAERVASLPLPCTIETFD